MTYLGFTAGTNLSLIVLLFVLYGAYAGAFRTVGKSFATDFVNPDLRATAVGIYSSTIGLMRLFTSIGAGYLWMTFGPSLVNLCSRNNLIRSRQFIFNPADLNVKIAQWIKKPLLKKWPGR